MKALRVFDGHCDTAVELWRRQEALADSSCQISLRRAEGFDAYVQVFAFCTAWLPRELQESDAFYRSMRYFSAQLERSRDGMFLCRTADDVESALTGHARGAVLAIEGAEAIGCDPGRLDGAYEAGVRMVTLTWNHQNALAGSCHTGEGLSAQGREFVRRAQRLGIIIDVSHLSDRAFWDVCELAEEPIVASHSNSRAVCPHPRNLTDEQFRAICQHGGTAGINLYSPFLSAEPATLDDVCRHIEHFCALGGAGHVALGGDLDGCDTLPEGFSGVEDYEKLAEALSSRGFEEEIMQEIFSDSLLKVVKRCIM